MLGDFHDKFPAIDILVTNEPSSAMVAAIGAGTLDVAIVGFGPDDLPPSVSHRTLHVDPLVAVVSRRHPLAGRAVVGVDALIGSRPFIHLVAGSGLRHGAAGVTWARETAPPAASRRFRRGRPTSHQFCMDKSPYFGQRTGQK